MAAMQKRRAFLRRLVDKRPNLVRLAASLGDPTAAPQHEDAPATSSTSEGPAQDSAVGVGRRALGLGVRRGKVRG